ncbi:unnamed protein product [Brassicogethes aeneus]|uniref:Uncharacterized protein n=1 Tax=Brassicogethes aeneus TaxID=1431903 RepID=A0A9P0BCW2_BRAAE|nr:unnamed protein product [Brassicogethes aeneus]
MTYSTREELRSNAASVPEEYWAEYPCVVKCTGVESFKEALIIEKQLSKCLDTDAEEELTMFNLFSAFKLCACSCLLACCSFNRNSRFWLKYKKQKSKIDLQINNQLHQHLTRQNNDIHRSQYLSTSGNYSAINNGLTKLLYIARGDVKVDHCPNICYVDTINWKMIGAHDLHYTHLNNQTCEPCPDICKAEKRRKQTLQKLNNLRYDLYDAGPYIVNVESILSNINYFKMGKLLSKEFESDIVQIAKRGRNGVALYFKKLNKANQFLENQVFLQAQGFSAFIPRHLITSKGFIRNIDKDLSEEEIAKIFILFKVMGFESIYRQQFTASNLEPHQFIGPTVYRQLFIVETIYRQKFTVSNLPPGIYRLNSLTQQQFTAS